MMRVILAKSSGFCFGVRRAIEIAEKTAARGKEVFVHGDIVHNKDVVRRIQKAGVRKIKKLGKGEGKILLIRAHGCSQKLLQEACSRGYEIVDATCPMVKHIHYLARKSQEEKRHLVVIGDRYHDEVRGILGQVKGRAEVFPSHGRIPWERLKSLVPITVVVQSTEDLEKVNLLAEKFREKLGDVKFYNTICQPTRKKQEEIRSLPKKSDVVIVIGSRSSANTRRLYEIARSLNPRTYWVESVSELQPAWLVKAKTVAVTAGASTPDEITTAVVNYLRKAGKAER